MTAPPMSPTAPATGAGSAGMAPGSNASAGIHPPPPPPADAPRTAVGSGEPPAADPQRPASGCEDLNVDDVTAQAQNQYTAGFAKAALAIAVKALQCRQDVRLYRYAATYACAARDAASAKQFLSKLPPQFQTAIIQRCLQESITLP